MAERSKKLMRASQDRMIGGVASGLAHYFNQDPTLVRVIFVISVLIFGIGVLPYIILWIVMPESKRI